MTSKVRNLLVKLPEKNSEETFESLLQRPGLRIERIVSWGHVTPDWYQQEQDEWVMVLTGAARLQVDDDEELEMTTGDSVFLPSGCRHRVAWTHADEPTIWLAVHYWPERDESQRDESQRDESQRDENQRA